MNVLALVYFIASFGIIPHTYSTFSYWKTEYPQSYVYPRTPKTYLRKSRGIYTDPLNDEASDDIKGLYSPWDYDTNYDYYNTHSSRNGYLYNFNPSGYNFGSLDSSFSSRPVIGTMPVMLIPYNPQIPLDGYIVGQRAPESFEHRGISFSSGSHGTEYLNLNNTPHPSTDPEPGKSSRAKDDSEEYVKSGPCNPFDRESKNIITGTTPQQYVELTTPYPEGPPPGAENQFTGDTHIVTQVKASPDIYEQLHKGLAHHEEIKGSSQRKPGAYKVYHSGVFHGPGYKKGAPTVSWSHFGKRDNLDISKSSSYARGALYRHETLTNPSQITSLDKTASYYYPTHVVMWPTHVKEYYGPGMQMKKESIVIVDGQSKRYFPT